MNYTEYESKIKEIEDNANKAKRSLMTNYVDANNPYKVGDKVTDHVGTVVVELIKYDWGLHSRPCAIYYGTEINKDGNPNKRGNKRYVYQSNLINK